MLKGAHVSSSQDPAGPERNDDKLANINHRQMVAAVAASACKNYTELIGDGARLACRPARATFMRRVLRVKCIEGFDFVL
jgi:hypothetical protein